MDHDRVFKLLLTTFFREFVELFARELARHVDWNSVEFLDKEIFTDIASKERHEVDLLVKVKFKGKETCFLIHVENQATPAEQFASRMFRYFARLHEKFGLPVYPIVVFSYDRPKKRARDRYLVTFPGRRVLDFRFDVVQLNRLKWRSFLKRPNAAASALMAKMEIPTADRPYVKVECRRMIAELRLDKARSSLIWTFMESYLKLTKEENLVYNQVMKTTAPKIKDTELRLSAPGVADKAREIALMLVTRRFGRVPVKLQDRIFFLDEQPATELAASILDFKTLKDVEKWVAAHLD